MQKSLLFKFNPTRFSRRITSSYQNAKPTFLLNKQQHQVQERYQNINNQTRFAVIHSFNSSTTRHYGYNKGINHYVSNHSRYYSSDQTSTRTMKEDIAEYSMRDKTGTHTNFDREIIPIEEAKVFPRIKTTSLSTKCMIIHDEAKLKPVTLVLVAFRSFADNQLDTWKAAFSAECAHSGQWFDITINESFGAQALSGFVQRWQRGKTAPELHDYYVAFNSRAREPLEKLLYTENRMYGNILLLDRQARVRFRASGAATDQSLKALLSCTSQIIREDEQLLESS